MKEYNVVPAIVRHDALFYYTCPRFSNSSIGQPARKLGVDLRLEAHISAKIQSNEHLRGSLQAFTTSSNSTGPLSLASTHHPAFY